MKFRADCCQNRPRSEVSKCFIFVCICFLHLAEEWTNVSSRELANQLSRLRVRCDETRSSSSSARPETAYPWSA